MHTMYLRWCYVCVCMFTVNVFILLLSGSNIFVWLSTEVAIEFQYVLRLLTFVQDFPQMGQSQVLNGRLQLAVPCAPLQLELVFSFSGAVAFLQRLQTQLLWQILQFVFGTGIPEQGKGQSNVFCCWFWFVSEQGLLFMACANHTGQDSFSHVMLPYMPKVFHDTSHALMQKKFQGWILCNVKSAKLSTVKHRQL